MDSIQDMALKYDLKGELIVDELIKKAIALRSPTNVGLKSFTIYVLVWVYFLRWQDDPNDDDDAALADGNQSIESEDDEPRDPPYKYVKKADKKALWELCKNDFDFFFAFDRQVEDELQERREVITDPRHRDEESLRDRCWFHCHKLGFDCRADQTKEAELKFIPNAANKK
jgi:hypothetical protein